MAVISRCVCAKIIFNRLIQEEEEEEDIARFKTEQVGYEVNFQRPELSKQQQQQQRKQDNTDMSLTRSQALKSGKTKHKGLREKSIKILYTLHGKLQRNKAVCLPEDLDVIGTSITLGKIMELVHLEDMFISFI